MTSMKRRLLCVLAPTCAVLAIVSGCVSKPVVSLDHAALSYASFRGIGLDVFLKVVNENSYDVQVRNVRADVTIAGRYALAPIDIQPNTWLPADETTLVRVPVLIPWQIVPGLLNETVGSPSISYRVRGSADVTAVRMLGIERNDYPVDQQGTVPRQQLINSAAVMMRR